MLFNLVGKFSKTLGVIFIIGLCSLAIFMSFLSRDIQNDKIKEITDYTSSLENRFYDFRMMQLFDPEKKKTPEQIILIEVDDKSLAKINSWPIPRSNWALMLNNLKEYNTKIVAFDAFFPEKSMSCQGEQSEDELFANAISQFQEDGKSKVILAYTLQPFPVDTFKEIPPDLYSFILESKQSGEVGLQPKFVEKNTYPIDEILGATPDLAYINMLEDSDGLFRHYQLVANVDMIYLPSLALRIYDIINNKPSQIEVNQFGQAKLPLYEGSPKQKDVFINNMGETKVRWYGNEYIFKTVSLYDVIHPKDEAMKEEHKKLFNNAITFVGSTATGAHDFRNSPIDAKMPGVLAHMNMLYMLMNDFHYQSLEDSIKYSFIIMAIGLTLLFLVMTLSSAIFDLLALIAINSAALYVDLSYFLPQGYELKLLFVLISFGLSYSWITFLNFYIASREKKQIKGAFSRYVAPAVVDDMLDHPDKLKVGGEKRDITCLFSDVRDFTSISEALSASQLAQALNRYMGEMTDIVFATNGTLDKYIGDAIVAFWGAPLDIGDHVDQALDASVKMLEALPAINEEFKANGTPEFKIGLGLNSGECSVGNMGSDQIFAYTALGDNMNLGARLESLCKHYGAQILISEYTFERMDKNKYSYRLIDKVRVKGKSQPVGVYEILYSYHPFMKDQEGLKLFKESYQKYLDAHFQQAKEGFEKLLEKHPEDKACLRLLAACEKWIEMPPTPDEDHTITTMTEK